MSILKVKCNGYAMMQDPLNTGSSNRKYIGWQFDSCVAVKGKTKGAFVPKEFELIDETNYEMYPGLFEEIKIAVRKGVLLAADEETAKECGLK
jgi:hypothetical protein